MLDKGVGALKREGAVTPLRTMVAKSAISSVQTKCEKLYPIMQVYFHFPLNIQCMNFQFRLLD